MAVGTGGGGAGGATAPPIYCQPKKFKIIKTMTYRPEIEIRLKYVYNS